MIPWWLWLGVADAVLAEMATQSAESEHGG